MNGIEYNRRLAWVATSILIVAGLLIGSRRSLHAMRTEVIQFFFIGQDGYCIQQSLEERAADAYNMVTVAKRTLPEEDEAIAAVLSARDALLAEDSIPEKYKRDVALETTVAHLSEKLKQANPSDSDEKLRSQVWAAFQSKAVVIAHDPYHDMAAAYNQKLKMFPANLLSRIVLAGPLEPFGARR